MQTTSLTDDDKIQLEKLKRKDFFNAQLVFMIIGLAGMPFSVLYLGPWLGGREINIISALVFFGIFLISFLLFIKASIRRIKINGEIKRNQKYICKEPFVKVKEIHKAYKASRNTWKTVVTYLIKGTESGKELIVSKDDFNALQKLKVVHLEATAKYNFIIRMQEYIAVKSAPKKTIETKRSEYDMWVQQYNDLCQSNSQAHAANQVGTPPGTFEEYLRNHS